MMESVVGLLDDLLDAEMKEARLVIKLWHNVYVISVTLRDNAVHNELHTICSKGKRKELNLDG